MRLLVVDDEASVREALALVLDLSGFEVATAANGSEAIRTLATDLLMRHPRQVLTRTSIFDRVWGYDFGPASNSLEVYVGYLRRKTEAAGESRLVHAVRGVGYVLRSAERAAAQR
jgi:two-component system, OmpR family, response regulator MprA